MEEIFSWRVARAFCVSVPQERGQQRTQERGPPVCAALQFFAAAFTALLLRRKYVRWRCALACERLRCEPWRPWGWGGTTRGLRRPARRGSQLCLAPLGALSMFLNLPVPDCLSILPSYCPVLGVLWVCSQSCVNFGAAEIQGPRSLLAAALERALLHVALCLLSGAPALGRRVSADKNAS